MWLWDWKGRYVYKIDYFIRINRFGDCLDWRRKEGKGRIKDFLGLRLFCRENDNVIDRNNGVRKGCWFRRGRGGV